MSKLYPLEQEAGRNVGFDVQNAYCTSISTCRDTLESIEIVREVVEQRDVYGLVCQRQMCGDSAEASTSSLSS